MKSWVSHLAIYPPPYALGYTPLPPNGYLLDYVILYSIPSRGNPPTLLYQFRHHTMQRTAYNTARAIASSSRIPPLPSRIVPPRSASLAASYASHRPARFVLPPSPHPSFPDLIHNLVQVVDPETGKLRPPQILSSIFADIDTTTHYPLLVKADPPIVRIKNIAEHIESSTKANEVNEARKKLESDAKEIQVPWTSADGDVKVKIALAEETLLNGAQANIIFAPKAAGGSRKGATPKERMNELVGMFDEALKDKGVKWRVDEVLPKMRKQFYNPLPELKKEAEKRGIEHSGERKKASLEKKEARRRKDEERRLKSLAEKAGQA